MALNHDGEPKTTAETKGAAEVVYRTDVPFSDDMLPWLRPLLTFLVIELSQALANPQFSSHHERRTESLPYRRDVIASLLTAWVSAALRPRLSQAAETVGKGPQWTDSTCLGVWDGLLADCPTWFGGVKGWMYVVAR